MVGVFTFWWTLAVFPCFQSLGSRLYILDVSSTFSHFFLSLNSYYPQRYVGRVFVIYCSIMWLLERAITNKPDLTWYLLFSFLCPRCFLIISPKNIVCLYLHPVLNPPGQHPEDPAKPLLCLRLCQTVEIELLFSDVRSSASACGISTGNSLPWQGLALVCTCRTAAPVPHCLGYGRGPTAEV